MIEMYLAGVSARRIEDVSEILWGSSVSAATVSNPNDRAFKAVVERRSRPWPAPTPMCSSTASASSAPGAVPSRTWLSWRPSA